MIKITRQQLDTLARSDLGSPARAPEAPSAEGKAPHARLVASCPEPPPRKRIVGFSG